MQLLEQNDPALLIDKFVNEDPPDYAVQCLTSLLFILQEQEIPLLSFFEMLKSSFIKTERQRSRAALLTLQILRRKKDFVKKETDCLILINFFTLKVLDRPCTYQSLCIIKLLLNRMKQENNLKAGLTLVYQLFVGARFVVNFYQQKIKLVCYQLYEMMLDNKIIVIKQIDKLALGQQQTSCCSGKKSSCSCQQKQECSSGGCSSGGYDSGGCGSGRCGKKGNSLMASSQQLLLNLGLQIMEGESTPENCYYLFKLWHNKIFKIFSAKTLAQLASPIWEFLDTYFPVDFDQGEDDLIKRSDLERQLVVCRVQTFLRAYLLSPSLSQVGALLELGLPSHEIKEHFLRLLSKELNAEGVVKVFRLALLKVQQEDIASIVKMELKKFVMDLRSCQFSEPNYQRQKLLLMSHHWEWFCSSLVNVLAQAYEEEQTASLDPLTLEIVGKHLEWCKFRNVGTFNRTSVARLSKACRLDFAFCMNLYLQPDLTLLKVNSGRVEKQLNHVGIGLFIEFVLKRLGKNLLLDWAMKQGPEVAAMISTRQQLNSIQKLKLLLNYPQLQLNFNIKREEESQVAEWVASHSQVLDRKQVLNSLLSNHITVDYRAEVLEKEESTQLSFLFVADKAVAGRLAVSCHSVLTGQNKQVQLLLDSIASGNCSDEVLKLCYLVRDWPAAKPRIASLVLHKIIEIKPASLTARAAAIAITLRTARSDQLLTIIDWLKEFLLSPFALSCQIATLIKTQLALLGRKLDIITEYAFRLLENESLVLEGCNLLHEAAVVDRLDVLLRYRPETIRRLEDCLGSGRRQVRKAAGLANNRWHCLA